MLSALLAIIAFLGRAVGLIGIGFDLVGRFLDVVNKAIQQSKLFMTIAFIGVVIGFFVIAEAFVEVALGLLGVNDLFNELVSYGFLSEYFDLTPLLGLGKWWLGYWITEKVMLSSMIGARVFFAFFGQFQKAIKL